MLPATRVKIDSDGPSPSGCGHSASRLAFPKAVVGVTVVVLPVGEMVVVAEF